MSVAVSGWGAEDAMDHVCLVLDGRRTELDVRPHDSLLRALRSHGHTATTGACEQGECGSCTVVLDGELRCACLVAAVVCDGATVDTAASLVTDDLSDALVEAGAVQCGFCTPGIVVSARWLLDNHSDRLDELTVREAMSGNLCRCTGYQGIVDAILSVDSQRRDMGASPEGRS